MRAAWILATATLAALPAAAGAAGSSQVGCVSSSGGSITYAAKPASCTFHSRGKAFAGYTQLIVRRITWTGWGTAHPTGRGTVYANMGYTAKVTITLSSRTSCNGHLRYKQAKFVYADDGRTGRSTLDTCTD